MVPAASLHGFFPRRRGNLAAHAVDDEGVILDRASGRVHQLNLSAFFIWQHLDGQRDLADLAELLVARFDVEPGQATGDVIRLVDQFGQQGLLAEDLAQEGITP